MNRKGRGALQFWIKANAQFLAEAVSFRCWRLRPECQQPGVSCKKALTPALMRQMEVESARLTPHCSEFFNRPIPIPIPISGPFPPLYRLPAHCAFRAGSLTTSNLKLPACPGQCGHISRSKITSSARFGVVWPFGGCGVNWRVTSRDVA